MIERSLTDSVNFLLKRTATKSQNEMQSVIHTELNFRRNSLNLLIGKRGSGKIYNVFREIIKLTQAGNNDYHLMIYVTNKTYDDTFF